MKVIKMNPMTLKQEINSLQNYNNCKTEKLNLCKILLCKINP